MNNSLLGPYLKATGWTVESSGVGGEMLSNSVGGETKRLAVPFGLEADTIDERVLVNLLARHLGVASEGLFDRIRSSLNDSQDFRIPTDDDQPGSIYLTKATKALDTAQKLLRAAATTAVRPRAAINGAFSKTGDAIANLVQLGHTQAGSYIFPFSLQVKTLEAQDGDPFSNLYANLESTERRVTRTLATALGALKQTVIVPDAEPNTETVLSLVEAGVSRELVQTLKKSLSPTTGLGDFKIDFRWSPLQDDLGYLEPSFELVKDSRRVLELLSNRLSTVKHEDVSLVSGQIIEIRKATERGGGHIAIQAVRNNRRVEIVASATPEQILQALEWAKAKRAIAIRGVVERIPGRHLEVREPVSLAPLDSWQLNI